MYSIQFFGYCVSIPPQTVGLKTKKNDIPFFFLTDFRNDLLCPVDENAVAYGEQQFCADAVAGRQPGGPRFLRLVRSFMEGTAFQDPANYTTVPQCRHLFDFLRDCFDYMVMHADEPIDIPTTKEEAEVVYITLERLL